MLTLNRAQNFADLSRPVLIVVQIIDEVCNRALKIDIIFSERVVRVDQQRLRQNSHSFPHCSFERIGKIAAPAPLWKSQSSVTNSPNQPNLPRVFRVINLCGICFRFAFFNI